MNRILLILHILIAIPLICNCLGTETSFDISSGEAPKIDTEFFNMDEQQDSIVAEATASLMKLSVRELKDKLQRHKVDFSDCVEKEDLVKKIVEHGAIHDEGQPESEPEAGPRPFSDENLEIAGLPCVLVSNAQSGEELDLLFVIMHGYGANQNDLVPIGKELLERLSASARSKKIALAFPGGPLTIPGYSIGRAWWHIDMAKTMSRVMAGVKLDSILAECPPDFKASTAKAIQFIQQVKARFNGSKKLMVGGFSQGAILSIQVSLELETAPDVTMVLSAAIVNSVEWETLLAQKGKNLNIIQSHGKNDQLLPFLVAQMLHGMFKTNGATTDWTEFDGAHSVPPTVIPKVISAMERLLSS